jgi:membrane-bound inhibitor of C-type lysozyme
MNKKLIGVVAVLTFFVGCGCQNSGEDSINVQEGEQVGADAITYICDGQTIKASFDNEVEPHTATIYVEEKNVSITLPNVESGSGARYSDGEITFWTHQDEATLSIEETDKIMNCQKDATMGAVAGEFIDENGNKVTDGCKTWFDGCNNCQVGSEGMMACTRKFCDPATMEKAKCLDGVEDGLAQ